MANVAILGHGVVGGGVAQILLESSARLKDKAGEDICLKYIVDIRKFDNLPYSHLFTADFNEVLNDESVKVVIEVIGGIKPAYDFVLAALSKGKSVVTSNKELVAKKGHELFKAAKENNCNFMFEASVGGGIPIIRPLNSCLLANSVKSVYGILNGTTNYILTKMANEGADFNVALKEAQALGYAEKDPSADVDGIDTCRKICILANIITGKMVPPEKVYTEGIKNITSEQVIAAKAVGGSIKLIGQAVNNMDGVAVSARPFVVKQGNPLYGIDDVYNGITVDGDYLDKVTFIGKGAGKLPTASAVVADIIDCVKSDKMKYNVMWQEEELSPKEINKVKYSWLVKLKNGKIDSLNQVEAWEGLYLTEELSFDELSGLTKEAEIDFVLPVLN